MEMRGMMGGFYKLSEWIMRLAVTNVLWIVCSLPFWLLSVFLLRSESPDQLKATIIFMAIVSPFTFFPATSAMFSVARKWVMGDTDVPLFRTFFRNYKANFLQAMLGGIIYALLFAILIIDYQVYLSKIPGFGIIAYLFIALLLLLVISLHHFFSLLSHFHMKTVQLLKNALVLTIGRPIRSFLMTIGTIVILLISSKFTFLIPFFFGSLIAVFTFYNFNLVVQKMMLLKDKEAQSEEEAGPEIPESQREMKS